MRTTLLVLLAVLIGLAALGSTLSAIDAAPGPEAADPSALDCLDRPDCAGAAAAGLLTVALLVAAVTLVAPPPTPSAHRIPVRSGPPGRLLPGGLYRPPRPGS